MLKGLSLHTFILLSLWGIGSCFANDSTELQRLQAKLDYAIWLKNRIEIGVKPCHSSECQQKKSQTLRSAFQNAEQLPGFININKAASFSFAYKMLDDPWVRPQNFFPENLSDWRTWWEHRFRDDSTRSILWMQYNNELMRQFFALDAFIDRQVAANANQKKLLDEAFQRGAGRICVLLRQVPQLMDQVQYLETTGRAAEADAIRQQAQALTQEREELEANFKGQFELVMKKLFPKLSFKNIVSTMSVTTEWMQELHYQELQNPRLITKLKYFREIIRKLQAELQEFNDLEFGLVGLRNFHTPVNPLIAAEQEAVIQEYLDLVDLAGRSLVGIAALYVSQSVMAGFTQSIFWRLGIPAIASSAAIQYDFEIEDIVWQKSTLTQELHSKLPKLEEESAKRFKDLLSAYQTVNLRIQTLEFQIESLKNNQTMILEGGHS